MLCKPLVTYVHRGIHPTLWRRTRHLFVNKGYALCHYAGGFNSHSYNRLTQPCSLLTIIASQNPSQLSPSDWHPIVSSRTALSPTQDRGRTGLISRSLLWNSAWPDILEGHVT